MSVNESLAAYGDIAHTSALGVYVLGLAGYAAEYAFTRTGDRAVDSAARRAQLVGVGAGNTTTGELPATPAPPGVRPDGRRSGSDRAGRIAVALTVLGALLHFGSLALRGFATSRWPLGNMYEYISAVCLVIVVVWLVVLRKNQEVRRLSVFVLLPMLLLLFVAGSALYAKAAPLVPSLRSYWITIHVSAAVIGSGIFMVSGVASLLYLAKTKNEANPAKYAGLAAKLPSADSLDRLAYRTTVFAFPLLTFGVVAGAIWAEAAWGRYWGWDPKETVAFISWIVYAAYLHARATAGWRGRRAAMVNAFGFVTVVFNLFFINLVITGLHSYAGVG